MSGNAGDLFALLIGIDCYLPNRLPGGYCYPDLGGCVRDVDNVHRELLQRRLNIAGDNVIKLTSTASVRGQPLEPEDQWPTYENMVAAFKRIADMAGPGDQVYIHYAGHGGRTNTIDRLHKGEHGIDEALVPMNIGNSKARYLRDIELAGLLNDMVKKGLIVTAVLDSCHSGGMVRGGSAAAGDVAVRGLGIVDTTPRPAESLVAPIAELIGNWDDMTQRSGTTRDLKAGSGWLPAPSGFVLLAACRPSESALEYAFEGRERNGVLTYNLLRSLDDLGPGLSYKTLHDRIVSRVHSRFREQTPMMEGDGARDVFGSERAAPYYAANVMSYDAAGNRVQLGAGQAHGLRRGARFRIYPSGTIDLLDTGKAIALAEISILEAADSWADIIERFSGSMIEQGAQAVLLEPNSIDLVSRVYLHHRSDLGAGVEQGSAPKAVEEAVKENRWLKLASTSMLASEDGKLDFQVAVNENGGYEIWDPSGRKIKNLRPELRAGEAGSAAGVVRRLEHLTKFNAAKDLRNHDPTSPLARRLIIELVGKEDSDYDPANEPHPKAFDNPMLPEVNNGEWAFLRIKNGFSEHQPDNVLNITVLDLQPDWGITQIYPSGAAEWFVPLDPGMEVLLPLSASLPEDYTEGTDTIKVFATLGSSTTSFQWLQLPRLDQPPRRATTRGQKPKDPLEAMMGAITSEQPIMRNLEPGRYPSRVWTTAEIELRTKRA